MDSLLGRNVKLIKAELAGICNAGLYDCGDSYPIKTNMIITAVNKPPRLAGDKNPKMAKTVGNEKIDVRMR